MPPAAPVPVWQPSASSLALFLCLILTSLSLWLSLTWPLS